LFTKRTTENKKAKKEKQKFVLSLQKGTSRRFPEVQALLEHTIIGAHRA
jgi:hypothetical protein